MHKYLITGGAGFIGSNFVKYMINKYKDDYFVCLDALTYASSIESLDEVINNKKFKFVLGNICDEELVDKLFREEKFDYVINFAAESHVDRSFIYEELFYKTNVVGVKVLLEASKKYKVKRFHQISTDEVYGELELTDTFSFKEEYPLNPTTPYSRSKAEADKLVLEYFNKYGLDVTISRSSNNYGIYQHPEKLIPKIVYLALSNKKITVYGDGSNVRDWIYVLDHCYAVDMILHFGKKGEIYNVGCNNEIANIDIIKRILTQLNINEYNFNYVNHRVHDDRRYSLNCEKLKKELSLNFNTNFNETFNNVVLWYKENFEWMKNKIE